MLSNPGGSVQWPMGRYGHSSVLVSNSTRPHLLVVGGVGTGDSWLFDIKKRIWNQLVSIIIILFMSLIIILINNKTTKVHEVYTCIYYDTCVCVCEYKLLVYIL